MIYTLKRTAEGIVTKVKSLTGGKTEHEQLVEKMAACIVPKWKETSISTQDMLMEHVEEMIEGTREFPSHTPTRQQMFYLMQQAGYQQPCN